MVVTRVMIKGMARAFYYENAGLFIIMFLLAFGFLSGNEHKAIAAYIASNHEILMLALIFWVLYIIKTALFFLSKLHLAEYRFIWSLSFLPKLTKAYILFIVQALMSVPVTMYCFLVLKFAIQKGNSLSVFIIVTFLLASHIILVLIYISRLNRSYSEQNKTLFHFLTPITSSITKPSWVWPIIHSLKSKPALWLVSKPLGILIFNIFILIDVVEKYDLRWISMGALVMFSTNLPILFELRDFFKKYEVVHNNLPRNRSNLMLKDLGMILLLLTPEIIFLLNSFPSHHSSWAILNLLTFGISLSWCAYLTLYLFSLDLETFLRRYFFVFILFFILILTGIPLVLLSLIVGVIILIIYFWYYRLVLN